MSTSAYSVIEQFMRARDANDEKARTFYLADKVTAAVQAIQRQKGGFVTADVGFCRACDRETGTGSSRFLCGRCADLILGWARDDWRVYGPSLRED